MKKNNRKAILFWAAWDNNFLKKLTDFTSEVRRNKIPYETLDVETHEGVAASIKYKVRNVPTIAIVENNKCIALEKGNSGYTKLKQYFK